MGTWGLGYGDIAIWAPVNRPYMVGDMGGHGGMRHGGEHKDMATWGHGVYR